MNYFNKLAIGTLVIMSTVSYTMEEEFCITSIETCSVETGTIDKASWYCKGELEHFDGNVYIALSEFYKCQEGTLIRIGNDEEKNSLQTRSTYLMAPQQVEEILLTTTGMNQDEDLIMLGKFCGTLIEVSLKDRFENIISIENSDSIASLRKKIELRKGAFNCSDRSSYEVYSDDKKLCTLNLEGDLHYKLQALTDASTIRILFYKRVPGGHILLFCSLLYDIDSINGIQLSKPQVTTIVKEENKEEENNQNNIGNIGSEPATGWGATLYSLYARSNKFLHDHNIRLG